MNKKCFFDSIIIILVLVFLIFLFKNIYFNNDKAKYIKVSNKTNSYYYNLDENRIIDIDGYLGKTKIEIKNNKVRVLESPCKHKYCISEKPIEKVNQTIICLPNKISISIEGEKDEIDSIAY